jgi:hypothetical protein
MKNEIIATLALLIQRQDLNDLGMLQKTRNAIFEILGWISLISGTLMRFDYTNYF